MTKKITWGILILVGLGLIFHVVKSCFFGKNSTSSDALKEQNIAIMEELSKEKAAREEQQEVNEELQKQLSDLNSALEELSKRPEPEPTKSARTETSSTPEVSSETTAPVNGAITASCWYFKQFFNVPVSASSEAEPYVLPHKYGDGLVRDLTFVLDNCQVTQVTLLSATNKEVSFYQANGLTYVYYYMPDLGDYNFEIQTTSGTYYVIVRYQN